MTLNAPEKPNPTIIALCDGTQLHFFVGSEKIEKAVTFATKIWIEESPRIDMVVIPCTKIFAMLDSVATMPSIQGENSKAVSRRQVTGYVQALNVCQLDVACIMSYGGVQGCRGVICIWSREG
jgi:hypothetical protein